MCIEYDEFMSSVVLIDIFAILLLLCVCLWCMGPVDYVPGPPSQLSDGAGEFESMRVLRMAATLSEGSTFSEAQVRCHINILCYSCSLTDWSS